MDSVTIAIEVDAAGVVRAIDLSAPIQPAAIVQLAMSLLATVLTDAGCPAQIAEAEAFGAIQPIVLLAEARREEAGRG